METTLMERAPARSLAPGEASPRRPAPGGFGAGWAAEAGATAGPSGVARRREVTVLVPHGSLWERGLLMAEAEIGLGMEVGGRWRPRGPARTGAGEAPAPETAPALAA